MPADFIAPLVAIAPAQAPAGEAIGGRAAAAVPGSFASFVTDGLARVDSGLQASQVDLQRLATGEVSSLHEVMVRLEESRLSMQLLLQVRNRLLESYQELMRMQV